MTSSEEDQLKKALQYAYKLLALRDRSRTEVFERLIKKGFQRGIAEEVVSRLQEKGYINDNRLADALIRVALEQKHYGRYAIPSYLQSKGIDDSVMEELDLGKEDYIASARRFVEKRLKTMRAIDADERAKRLSMMLQRRGHDFDTIREVLKAEGSEDG